MVHTVYVSVSNLNKLQTDIMHFIDQWVREQKTPVPQREIIENMKQRDVKDFTTVYSLNSLIAKGYIRRAYTISNRTFYVMLRKVA